MKTYILNDDLFVKGSVTVREIADDGTITIKKQDENVVVNSGILLMAQYLLNEGDSGPLSGITHLAVGDGTPQYIMPYQSEEDRKTFLYGLDELNSELLRVVRWDVQYWRKDEAGNMFISSTPTNIVDFIFRLRQKEPVDKIYISEIGMFGGTVRVDNVPYATPDQVRNKGTMFSYRYYDPPIDKSPDTILEFSWRINFFKRG